MSPKKTGIILSVLSCILFSFTARSQNELSFESKGIRVEPEWRIPYKNGDFGWAYDVVSDDFDNLYTTGYFKQWMGVKDHSIVPKCDFECQDLFFIVKHNSDGEVSWSNHAKGNARGFKLFADKQANVYVMGEVWSKELIFTSKGNADVKLVKPNNYNPGTFIAKYNYSGKLLSSHFFPYRWTNFTLDVKGNIYLTCIRLNDDVKNNTGWFMLRKYNADYELMWQDTGNGRGNAGYNAVCVDAMENVYVTGTFTDTAVFGSKIFYAFNNNYNICISRYDKNGRLLWVLDSVGSIRNGRGNHIVSDKKGNVYVNFADPQEGVYPRHSYLARVNAKAEIQWLEKIKQKLDNFVTKLVIDANDNLYICGQGYAALFSSKGIYKAAYKHKRDEGQNFFFARYSTQGELQWLVAGGKLSDNYCQAIAVNKNGVFRFAGVYSEFWLAKYTWASVDKAGMAPQTDVRLAEYGIEPYWGPVQPIIENGKWGFRNRSGKRVIFPLFDDIRPPTYDRNCANIMVSLNNKWGIMDTSGVARVRCSYDEIRDLGCNRFWVKSKGGWKLLDPAKNATTARSYDDMGRGTFHNYSILVKLNNKWGLVDQKSLAEVIPPVYDEIGRHDERTVYLRSGKKTGIAESTGRMLVQPVYDSVVYYHPRRFVRVKNNGKWGVVSTAGNTIVELVYDEIPEFNGYNYAPARVGGKWGILDTNGKALTPVKYDEVLINGYKKIAFVKTNGKWALLDSTGTEITAFRYDDISVNGDDLFEVTINKKHGVANAAGKEIIPVKYDRLDCYYNDIIMFSQNGKWGYMNMAGKEFVPARYDEAMCFSGNEAAVKLGALWGFIDRSGKEKIPPRYAYDAILPFSNGLAAVKLKEKWGYINEQGIVIIPIIYDAVSGYFSECKTGVSLENKWGIVDCKGKLLEPIEGDYDPYENDY